MTWTHGEEDLARLRGALQRYWGYTDFRSPQGEIAQALLQGEDTLVVLPTGAGKSLCFQLPALLAEGVTLVISPLVALMENQVQELGDRGIATAAALHSELPQSQKRMVLQALQNHRLRLLYLSPETLLSPPVWRVLMEPTVAIRGLILDEAHCLIQWGDSFRPSYLRLGAVRLSLQKSKPSGTRIPIAAFTATADDWSQGELVGALGLRQPRIFRLSPYRPNLHLAVKTIWTRNGRRSQLQDWIAQHPRQTGLVYGRSRRETEHLAQFFQAQGYRCAAYHAGLGGPQRRTLENQWLGGDLQFVVCTSAFGMGINKADVRWVAHYQAPALLTEYLQEVGRGGRDGDQTRALTLVSEPTGWLNGDDRQRRQFFLDQQRQQYESARRAARRLPPRGQVQDQGALTLALLHRLGQLRWGDPFTYELRPGDRPEAWRQLLQRQQQEAANMQRFLFLSTCRWAYVLGQFGFPQNGWRCGHCDRCDAGSRRRS